MDPRERFRSLVAGPPADLALDEAAFAIAATFADELSIDAQCGRLDALAAEVSPADLDGLLGHLLGVEGFTGARQSYYDPRNSLLDQVLDRRIGIPITLAVVIIEVGRRLGLELDGVGMPGHFLVRHRTGDGDEVFVDAFSGGRRMDRAGCREMFESLTGGEAAFEESFLDPVENRLILIRMLNNLKAVHAARRDTSALERVLELRTMFPELVHEQAELAALIGSKGRFAEAATMLEELAEAAPDVDLDSSTASEPSKRETHRSAAERFRARLN